MPFKLNVKKSSQISLRLLSSYWIDLTKEKKCYTLFRPIIMLTIISEDVDRRELLARVRIILG